MEQHGAKKHFAILDLTNLWLPDVLALCLLMFFVRLSKYHRFVFCTQHFVPGTECCNCTVFLDSHCGLELSISYKDGNVDIENKTNPKKNPKYKVKSEKIYFLGNVARKQYIKKNTFKFNFPKTAK